MKNYYSVETNVQYLISLLKEHNIKNVIISPGTTNFTFVGSIQIDPFFNLYSCVDERSAAYMACGMASVTGEPVVISCTGATASRNYIPGLTEAYYRKLPVLALTATRNIAQIGQNIDQVIDRSILPKDIAVKSVFLPIPHSQDDFWGCQLKINEALLSLRRKGGGPVHINYTTEYSRDFSVKELPKVNVINRYSVGGELPEIKRESVVIFIGAHKRFSDELVAEIDLFCEKYNGVVFCDQTSNYTGKYSVFNNLITLQKNTSFPTIELLIHLGDVSASVNMGCDESWRVNPDGTIRDTFKKLTKVFEMEELSFFKAYNQNESKSQAEPKLYNYYRERYDALIEKWSEIENDVPFSNVWIASRLHKKMPPKVNLFMGILNSLRSWNYFETDKSISGFANTGGFGIDGGMSSMIGASFASPSELCFLITGDLAFFYDLNSIGIRGLGNNIRILLVNNAIGEEFKHNLTVITKSGFFEEANDFMAAQGHFGNQSRKLVKHYAEDLGFEYLSASNKEEFETVIEAFLNPNISEKPVILEAFTDYQDETLAIDLIQSLEKKLSSTAKEKAKKIVGAKGVRLIKRIVKK